MLPGEVKSKEKTVESVFLEIFHTKSLRNSDIVRIVGISRTHPEIYSQLPLLIIILLTLT
jgi:hypothetical protein